MLQRLTYLAFTSIIIHGLSYQQIEQRHRELRFIFGIMVAFALLLQIGVWLLWGNEYSG